MERKYYEAYEDRYQQVHAAGLQWFADAPTPIVAQVLERYGQGRNMRILELGCGEGRDGAALLQAGYDVVATDISAAAIRYVQEKFPQYADHFAVLDCLGDTLPERFPFIYAVAVLHMLVEDEDRDGFYSFIREHLTRDGIGLICTIGDGKGQMRTDPAGAFDLGQRTHEQTGKQLQIANTSCRIVNFETFHQELERNGLRILEEGIAHAPPDFPMMIYAIVKGEE